MIHALRYNNCTTMANKRKIEEMFDDSGDESYDPRSHLLSQSSSSSINTMFRMIETDSDENTILNNSSLSLSPINHLDELNESESEEMLVDRSLNNMEEQSDDAEEMVLERSPIEYYGSISTDHSVISLNESTNSDNDENNLEQPDIEEEILEQPINVDEKYAKSLTKSDVNKLIDDADPMINFIQMVKQSDFWTNYQQVLYGECNTNFVICKTCKRLLTYNGANGTTSIGLHSTKCKKIEKNQSTLDNVLLRKMNGDQKNDLINAAAICSAVDSRAFKTYEGNLNKLFFF